MHMAILLWLQAKSVATAGAATSSGAASSSCAAADAVAVAVACDAVDLGDEQAEAEIQCSKEFGLSMAQYTEWWTSYRRGMPEDFHRQEETARRLLNKECTVMASSGRTPDRSSKRHRPVRELGGSNAKASTTQKRRCATRRLKRQLWQSH